MLMCANALRALYPILNWLCSPPKASFKRKTYGQWMERKCSRNLGCFVIAGVNGWSDLAKNG